MKYLSSVSELETYKMEKKNFVLLYCASWCKPCVLLKEWIDLEYGDAINVCVIDIDNPDMESICSHINALPTTEIYNASILVYSCEGFSKDNLLVEFQKIVTINECDLNRNVENE